jgi:hypothetical protein
MVVKKQVICSVKDCTNEGKGRQYCEKHSTAEARRKMTKNRQTNIISGCCDAKCVVGEVHDTGEQYCTKCKQPCVWKAAL